MPYNLQLLTFNLRLLIFSLRTPNSPFSSFVGDVIMADMEKNIKKAERNTSRRPFIIVSLVAAILISGYAAYSYVLGNKRSVAIGTLSMLGKAANLLPMEADKKKELEVVGALTEKLTKADGKEWKFMVFLQNNMELRPGGGFLGQYAIVTVKDGQITSTFVEDANLLDQRITAKVTAPYPFKKMMGTKNWKFRDSNFSPDFPTNVEKAMYFYRLSGRSASGFDGFVAINTDVFDHALELTGPLTVPGYNVTLTSADGSLKLEDIVEKRYILDSNLDTQNRKAILKTLTPLMAEKLFTVANVGKLAEFAHSELAQKNIMVHFADPELQKLVESVHWDGKVATDWQGDYLMVVDANLGALKSDHWMKREMTYEVDLTQPKPKVTLDILYTHTATHGDWRTSDYHSYLRVYAPQGANLLERQMVSYPNIGEELGKTFFGFTLHTLINRSTQAHIVYELPETIDRDTYKLLIQKQSGVGNVPVTVRIRNEKGEFEQKATLESELKFEFKGM